MFSKSETRLAAVGLEGMALRSEAEELAYSAFCALDCNDVQYANWQEARDAGDEAGMARAAEVLDRQGAGARAIAEAWGF